MPESINIIFPQPLPGDFHPKPRPGVSPPLFRGRHCDAQNFSRLLECQTYEIPQFDQLRLARIARREFFQRFVYRQQLVVWRGRGDVQVLPGHRRRASAAFGGLAAAGAIDENAAHRLGGDGKEVLASIPVWLCSRGDFQPRFMHESGGLERVLVAFPRQAMRRQPAQFIIDQRQQLRPRARIAIRRGPENFCDVGHAGRLAKQTMTSSLLLTVFFLAKRE
jgi:hypothetical protein